MAFYEPEFHDYGKKYKTFKELKNDDIVFVVDFRNIQIQQFKIKNHKCERKEDDYYTKSQYIVEFEMVEQYNEQIKIQVKVYDGNSFIFNSWDGHDHTTIVTDKRIAESICEILRCRNNYQWNTFTHLFGNPLSGYAHQPVVLC